MFGHREKIFVSVSALGSEDRAPKPLRTSWVTGVCFVLMRRLQVGSWGRLVIRKTEPRREALNSQPPLPYFSRVGRGLEMEFMTHHAYVRKPP